MQYGQTAIKWILEALKTQGPEVLKRLELLVEIGADGQEDKNTLHYTNFVVKGDLPGWAKFDPISKTYVDNIDFQTNDEIDESVVPKVEAKPGLRHMFSPESLLKRKFPAYYDNLMKQQPYNQCQASEPKAKSKSK